MSDNKVTNSNLEFRKIKSLDYKYEVNSNGTIFRNSKSKKQNKISLSQQGFYEVQVEDKVIKMKDILNECFNSNIKEFEIIKNGISYHFSTRYETCKFIEANSNIAYEKIRSRLKDKRRCIGGFDIIYHLSECRD